MPTRVRLADESKQLGKSYCNNSWQINTTMLMFVNSNYHSYMQLHSLELCTNDLLIGKSPCVDWLFVKDKNNRQTYHTPGCRMSFPQGIMVFLGVYCSLCAVFSNFLDILYKSSSVVFLPRRKKFLQMATQSKPMNPKNKKTHRQPRFTNIKEPRLPAISALKKIKKHKK
jgi:hypothetical protein